MAMYFRAQRVCPIVEGGGASGYKVYLINVNENSDTGLIGQNDEDMYELVSGSGSNSRAYSILNGVESISLSGFDHWGGSIGSNSASWGAWRPHQDNWQSWTGTGGTLISGAKTSTTFSVTEDIDLIIHSGTCLTGDMLILMADGTEQRVDTIKVGDLVMTPEGPEKVTWSDSDIIQYGDAIDHWYFEDVEIKTINPHRFYNCERKEFVYLHDWKKGEHTIDVEGNEIMLTGHLRTLDKERHYTIFVDGCNAYYVNGLLSGNRFSKVKI